GRLAAPVGDRHWSSHLAAGLACEPAPSKGTGRVRNTTSPASGSADGTAAVRLTYLRLTYRRLTDALAAGSHRQPARSWSLRIFQRVLAAGQLVNHEPVRQKGFRSVRGAAEHVRRDRRRGHLEDGDEPERRQVG